MHFISYEWPTLVAEQYAQQIRSVLANDNECPFDTFRGQRAVMFGLLKEDADGVRVTVLLDEDHVLGYALYNSAELSDIYVFPEYRGNNYGGKLLDAVKSWYCREEIDDVDITVLGTEQARRFWQDRAIFGGIGECKLKFD
ncbi:GNAT family N-acetyltransferase [Pantoea sp. LMR881]|uniref:GNAT family N-acetyltransferase n=1 Tax=Pantoea sp. LMR881 TaxID=3014336 RepID=UPI0022B079BD|nr:GNAT family N-acetyltransferase [Pantoea sp. LMR881]MCZ4058185.1 GNAT family N-acetyltransferase [Pantoea sp. LMR881]